MCQWYGSVGTTNAYSFISKFNLWSMFVRFLVGPFDLLPGKAYCGWNSTKRTGVTSTNIFYH